MCIQGCHKYNWVGYYDKKSFKPIVEHLNNHLLGAQLAFFKTLSTEIQPLLEEHQNNTPLAPFLYSSLRTLIIAPMERFIIPEKVSPIIKILKNSENMLPAAKLALVPSVQLESVKISSLCFK